MNIKGFLTGAFLVAATVGGGMLGLRHENKVTQEAVEAQGFKILENYADTGWLWGDRHGCPMTGSGTEFYAVDSDHQLVLGVACHTFFGKTKIIKLER